MIELPTEFTILAPGPSLADVKDFDPQGPVVAVNRAILSGLPYDIWCCQDDPKKLSDVVGQAQGKLIWCADRHEQRWRSLGLRTWSHPHVLTKFKESVGIEARVNFCSRTVLIAMGRAYGCGAKRMVFHGVDMEGEGYAYGEDIMKRDERAWEQRWGRERVMFTAAVEAMRENGVEVVGV